MALINCPECKKEVSDSALSCPHCGFELSNKKEKTEINQVKKPKKKDLAWTTWLLIAAIMYVLFYIFGSGGDNNSSNKPSPSSKFSAYIYAEDFVSKKLKSPSTAEFPGVSEKDKHITSLGNDTYKIVSWVDSQNGFGATIRTGFSCTIIFEGNNVRCKDLKFDE
ncbi:MAG: zinc ribbon domain-containing protein [Bacteroidales bacterium]|jgi:DNA-directed RNA polymerase subunit RPC12/RpoP|nr:zinc ribbon domain-containing protein [Bacteroidales bacterium]